MKSGMRNLSTAGQLALLGLLLGIPAWASKPSKAPPSEPGPELLLDGGRKLVYEQSFNSEHEVKPKRGFWTKVLDVVAGEPDYRELVAPYSITTDSRGRIIVTDPGAFGVHIFDFAQQKYKFLSRADKGKDAMGVPQCVAVDAQDNIYVTDSEAGKIFVFNADGKYQRAIGSLKGGEGFFKRPTGIAVDSAQQRIYVTDTLRNQVYVLDMQGSVLQVIGKTGSGNGEFKYAIGQIDDSVGGMFRPKGIGFDSEGHLYVVDGLWGVVQVFNGEGQLLYYFGNGTGEGEFQMPAGLQIDKKDRVYVVDSYNRRIQVFQYFGAARQAGGGAH